MTIINLWVGSIEGDAARVAAKLEGVTTARLAVDTDSSFGNPVFFTPDSSDNQGVRLFSPSGLALNTEYFYAVEEDSVVNTGTTGRFHTAPGNLGTAISYTFATSGDAGLNPDFPDTTGNVLAPDQISNSPVFDTIRTHSSDPLFFVHLGDLHYYNLGSGSFGINGGGSLSNYRRAYDDVLLQTRQHELMRSVPTVLLWDDHDYGPNNSDGTLPDKQNAAAVYRERVPSYALTETGAIYHTWQIGRVQFVMLDCRYHRSPNSDPDGPSKTMLGSGQKTWLTNILNTSSADALVIFSSIAWLEDSGGDGWRLFGTERAQLGDLFISTGWADRMVMISADWHAMAMDTGANNSWGGFRNWVFASLDAAPSAGVSSDYDVGAEGARQQYGIITVDDDGDTVRILAEGWQDTTLIMTDTLSVSSPTPTPPPPSPSLNEATLTRVISGSHGIVFDVRVLEEFQTGNDPTGTTIAFPDSEDEIGLNVGEVEFDATRTTRGTAFIRVPGTRGSDGPQNFPRGRDQLLAPYGNEIFIRYGIDLGDTYLWTSMGYFGITDTHQDDVPDSPVELFCHDRSYVIEISELINPRSFEPPATVGDVFTNLTGDIFPGLVIEFDDATVAAPLASQVIAEKNRWKPLVELADSFGKIVYFNGEGVLRIETPPDPDDIVWDIRSNADGVMINSIRELSREGIYNAVVVEGEKTGDADPVRGVAINSDPNSPTRFGGPIGKVPTFLTTPLVSTTSQAQNAARFLLQRAIGAPYSAKTQAIVNPALRPHEAIKLIYSDNSRDEFLVDRVRIPLDEDAGMNIDLREKALVVVSNE